MNFLDRMAYLMGYQRLTSPAIRPVSVQEPITYASTQLNPKQVAPELQEVASYPIPMPETAKNITNDFQKNAIQAKEGLAQDPIYLQMQRLQTEQGLRKPTKITFSTLRRMSRANWVDRTCINTLRDEITAVPWDIVAVDPKRPYSEGFRQYLIDLLKKPNRNNENWRTFIDKIMEDILVLDAGCVEIVRDQKGRIAELWYVDGATIKPCYDEKGYIMEPAYQQYFPTSNMNVPVAEFDNKDLIYMMWNPQGANDVYGYGMSPVESGLAVGTAFLYAEAYNMGFFNQNAIPPTIINLGPKASPAQVQAFQAFLMNEMMGSGGFWKPVIGNFGDGFSVEPILKSPADLQLINYVTWQMRWKVALYRMSPQDIGFTLDQYKAEGQVQQQLSKNKAIDSLKQVLADYINREILGDEGWPISFKEMNLHFQWTDTDSVDPYDQAEIDDIYIKNGTKAVNEIRQERFGLDPIVGGQKPYIMNGQSILPLDPTPLDEAIDEDEEKSLQKQFSPEEGTIQDLSNNQTAITWMDDRGVTQPLFVTDYGKTYGFTVKPNFLDERRDQDPPEATVAKLLRVLKVNTPEVKIMNYDDVIRLFPPNLVPEFTKWINLEAPYNSQEWRQRWGNTRNSEYFIVTGYIAARDLHNEELLSEMAENPESFKGAIADLARVWLAEKRFFLGDRKPGHYLITKDMNGFGVDYQFFDTEASWNKSNHWLPDTLEETNPKLRKYFNYYLANEFINFDFLEKAFKGRTKKGIQVPDVIEIEKQFAKVYQAGIFKWFKKAVRVINIEQSYVTVKKTIEDFDPEEDYVSDGNYVYQNDVRYPVSVLGEQAPSVEDIAGSVAAYRSAFSFGALQASLQIKSNLNAQNIKLANPALYAGVFASREEAVANSVSETLTKELDAIISKGFEQDMTYGEVAQLIAGLMGINLQDPSAPGWKAMQIARTETNWAINEGMRQQYQESGIQKVNIEAALTACDLCMAAVNGNPYTLADADGMLPIHPNCRCVWIGDWTNLLKMFKKGWVTINGSHILLGSGGGDEGGGGSKGGKASAGGGGLNFAQVPNLSLKRTDMLTTEEGAPDAGRVSQYKQLIENGHSVAPVMVTKVEGGWGIVDGNHRFQAMKDTGARFIPTITKENYTGDTKTAYDKATEADQTAISKL